MLNPLVLLRVYNQLYTVTDVCVKHVSYLWKTLVDAYTVKTHIFFQGLGSPYCSSLVNIGAPSSAIPLWYYRDDTKTFVEWSLRYQGMANTQAALEMNQLPILSMTILDKERVIHDLTDFLSSIRVFHSNSRVVPSIAHIIGAWSLSSGIILNPLTNYSTHSITISAETITVPINNNDYFNVVLTNQDATSVAQST